MDIPDDFWGTNPLYNPCENGWFGVSGTTIIQRALQLSLSGNMVDNFYLQKKEMKYYLILLVFFIFSCQLRETPQSSYPVIHLNPDKAGILKMSDHFDNYQIVHFKNAICNTIQDIAKYQDKYITITRIGLSTGFYVFDSQGNALYPIGKIGRGPGEYIEVGDDLLLDRDNNILLINSIQCLKYAIDGKIIEDYKWPQYSFGLGSPRLFLNDTTLIYYKSSTLAPSAFATTSNKNSKINYLLTLQSIPPNKKPIFCFPADKLTNYDIHPQLYQYQDSNYFYYDNDKFIYQITQDGPIPRYEMNKGKYPKLKTFQEFQLQTPVPGIQIQILNESESYIWGKYLFSGHYYLFFYNKATHTTQNYQHINNDFIETNKRNRYFPEQYHTRLKNKLQCDPDYQYYYYTPSEFLKMIESVRSKKSDSEWKTYCQKNPSLIQTYLEINDHSNAVVIGYHFK